MNHWIDSPERLTAHFADWSQHKTVALDTEFVREKTYYPQLALVQLAVPGEILLIDPLVSGMAEVLKPWLLNPDVCKIIHSPSEDLQAFSRGVGAVPVNIFDTQAAAALCGMGAGLGYQKLIEAVTGIVLEKGETRSDWLKRPLTDSQCRYAADDVLYLHEVHALLSEKLVALDRLHWLEADGERAVRNANNDTDDPYPHLSLSRAQGLDHNAQALLCRLLRWRDAKARSTDRPKSWILDNELAAFLARSIPEQYNAFTAILDRSPKAPRKFRTDLWEEVIRPLTQTELDIPAIKNVDTIDKQKLRTMQEAVVKQATALNIPEGLLASRKHLEALMEGQWPASLEGWRREQLEPLLGSLMPAVTDA
jgi:ribonuclease D